MTRKELDEIDLAIAARPTNARNHLRRAELCLKDGTGSGRQKEAMSSYARALELDPTLYAVIEDEYCSLRGRLSDLSCFLTLEIPGGAAVYDAVFWPDRDCVICATANTNIYVFDLMRLAREVECYETKGDSIGMVRAVLEGHDDIVTTLALSPDGHQLLSGSLDKTVRVWDLRSISSNNNPGKNPETLHITPRATLEGHKNRINRLRWTPCGKMAISSSTDATLRLWNVLNGSFIYEMVGHGSLVSSIDLSKEGTVCASASGDAVCKLWGIPASDGSSNGNGNTRSIQSTLLEDIAWESGPVVLCKFVDYDSHGEYLLTAHAQLVQQQARILLWDVFDKDTGWVDGRLRAPCYAIDDLRGCPTCMDTVRIRAGEFAGAELLACACSDGKVHVWDIDECPIKLETFSLEEPGQSMPEDLPAWSVAHLRHASNKLNIVSFSPSGTYLAATRSASSSVVVWDIDEGECVRQYYGHSKPIRKLVWISDYKLISFSEDGTVRGWSILDPAENAVDGDGDDEDDHKDN
jgi:WD40 repeat protein